jgi:Uma2 family endonuclease
METAVRSRLFTVDEYYAMGDAGVFGPEERVELLEGRIIAMPPIGPEHAGVVGRLMALFMSTFGTRVGVRVQNPVRLSRNSEPQPDIALLRPRLDFYVTRHPESDDIFALIEVAGGSLPYDRGRKLRAYARRGVAEYWIVDLAVRSVEMCRVPSTFGYEYRSIATKPDDVVAFEAFPSDTFSLVSLLGPPISDDVKLD